jgi:hypothetical protein
VSKPSEIIEKRAQEIWECDPDLLDATDGEVRARMSFEKAILEFLDSHAHVFESRPWDAATREDAGEESSGSGHHSPSGGALFGTPPELIPEGAEEFISDGFRALRFVDSEGDNCEARIASDHKWDARWPDGYESISDWSENPMFTVNKLSYKHDPCSPAHLWLRYWLANFERPIASVDAPGSDPEGEHGSARAMLQRHGLSDPSEWRKARNLEDALSLVASADGPGSYPEERGDGDALDMLERHASINSSDVVIRDIVDGVAAWKSERAHHAEEVERERSASRELRDLLGEASRKLRDSNPAANAGPKSLGEHVSDVVCYIAALEAENKRLSDGVDGERKG